MLRGSFARRKSLCHYTKAIVVPIIQNILNSLQRFRKNGCRTHCKSLRKGVDLKVSSIPMISIHSHCRINGKHDLLQRVLDRKRLKEDFDKFPAGSLPKNVAREHPLAQLQLESHKHPRKHNSPFNISPPAPVKVNSANHGPRHHKTPQTHLLINQKIHQPEKRCANNRAQKEESGEAE